MDQSSLEIAALLAALGFDTPAGAETAREALVLAKLTRPGKERIDASKKAKVEAELASRFIVTCGAPACAATAGDRIAVKSADPAKCSVCGGSANRRAIDHAAEAFARIGVRRIVVVGGSPAVHTELRALAPAAWELRLVDGTARRTSDAAKADTKWADLVLIWGSSELGHKVSGLYVAERDSARNHLVHATRRGIGALFEEAAEWARRRTR